jgi:FkbM family methyltransferase
MFGPVKRHIRAAARNFGVEIGRYRPYRNPINHLIRICKENGCDTILDIGANAGQFAERVLQGGFDGRIISFEPQTKAHALLVKAADKLDGWDVASRMCVGEKDATTRLNIAANSTSSSILPVLGSSTSAKPETAYVTTEDVLMRRLDSWIAEELPDNSRSLAVKIDVQGYEDHVLDGAKKELSRIIAFQIEMSLMPLYEGSPSFVDLYSRIEAMGYQCVGLYPGFTDVRTYQMMQVDGLFLRL